jgi:hypothetical protein
LVERQFIAQRSHVSAPQVAGRKGSSSGTRELSAAVRVGLRESAVKNTFLFCEQKQKDIRQDQQDCAGFACIKLMNPVNPVGPISFFHLLTQRTQQTQ